MLVVLDHRRNLVGQIMRHTREACRSAMNDLFEAKGLGVYSGHNV